MKLRALELALSAGATTKRPPGPLRAGIDGFTPKIEPLSVSPFRVFQSVSEYSWCVHYVTTPLQTIDPLHGPQHEKAQIDPNMLCTACSTSGTISSVLRIISFPAAGIKPLLVSRSTTQNSGVLRSLQMTSPIARDGHELL